MDASSLFATVVILLLQAAFALRQICFARAIDRRIGPGRAALAHSEAAHAPSPV